MKDPFQLNKYAELMGLGIEIAASMVLPVVVGIYIDHRFETTPWGVLIGAFVGMLSMALKLYKVAMLSNNKGRKSSKDQESR
jgi:F0F1-type ATP synthase assembly protein I